MGIEFNSLIRDYSDNSTIAKFSNQLYGNDKEYPMLRWNKQDKKLEVTLKSKTSLKDRILKWFGVGPLSLKKIAAELEKNKDQLDALRFKVVDQDKESLSSLNDVSRAEVEDFATDILNQFNRYNHHRLINITVLLIR